MKEADEIIECHNNFLKIFESKFTEKFAQQISCNSELDSQLETELIELKNQNDANNAIIQNNTKIKFNVH